MRQACSEENHMSERHTIMAGDQSLAQMTLPQNADSLQFGPYKDTEEMVEFERLGGKDVFKTDFQRE